MQKVYYIVSLSCKVACLDLEEQNDSSKYQMNVQLYSILMNVYGWRIHEGHNILFDLESHYDDSFPLDMEQENLVDLYNRHPPSNTSLKIK